MNKENLHNFIKEIQRKKKLISYDEAAIKQVIILKILSLLDWDIYNIDEVQPEYTVGIRRVDYALKFNGNNKVFLEVKRTNEDLENHQEQILNYSFQEGVPLSILTNGITWWFYLPLREGSWEQRRFYTIEIYEQDSNDITEKFINFLSHEKVINGENIKTAYEIFTGKQKQNLIQKTIPRAWDKLIREPDELLIELLAETTEKMCGYKPTNDILEKFLSNYLKQPVNVSFSREKINKVGQTKLRKITQELSMFTGKSIKSFSFNNKKYSVRTWKEMLLVICKIMYTLHKDRFEQLLSLKGRKRVYFSRNPNKLFVPGEIEGTGMYAETNLNASRIIKIVKNILILFGYNENSITIETY